jgi:hypothetical protein
MSGENSNSTPIGKHCFPGDSELSTLRTLHRGPVQSFAKSSAESDQVSENNHASDPSLYPETSPEQARRYLTEISGDAQPTSHSDAYAGRERSSGRNASSSSDDDECRMDTVVDFDTSHDCEKTKHNESDPAPCSDVDDALQESCLTLNHLFDLEELSASEVACPRKFKNLLQTIESDRLEYADLRKYDSKSLTSVRLRQFFGYILHRNTSVRRADFEVNTAEFF